MAEMTTVQIDQETLVKLGTLALAYERSKAAQIRYMVNSEYDKLAAVKLRPGDAPKTAQQDQA